MNPGNEKSQSGLAIFGGIPAFEKELFVGTPNILNRERFLKLVNEALDAKILTNFGPLNQRLQKEVCKVTGAKYCVTVCNATVGLELALLALGIKGEVILPSFTFIATAHSLKLAGLTPVFCDVDVFSHTLSVGEIEKAFSEKTGAILGVHLWGQVCPGAAAIDEFAKSQGIVTLYDAAHAFGSSLKGRPASQFGKAQVYSFHATKFVNSFEGGAITTDSEELYAKIRLLTNFGFTGPDKVVGWGTNGKLNEISAAMGIAEIEELDKMLSRNKKNFLSYKNALEMEGVRLLTPSDSSNFQYVVTQVDSKFGITRDQMLQVLCAENLMARRYFFPGCHRMEPYVSDKTLRRLPLPMTERIAESVLVLPSGETVDDQSIATIAEIFRRAKKQAKEIAAFLPASIPPGSLASAVAFRESLRQREAA